MQRILLVLTALLACSLPLFAQKTETFPPMPQMGYAGTTLTFKLAQIDRGVGKLPKWIPKFKKGQKVKFKFGKSGQLIIPSKGISVKLSVDGNLVNTYYWQSVIKGPTAMINKEINAGFRKKDSYPYKRGIVLYFSQGTYPYNNGPVTSRSVTYIFE